MVKANPIAVHIEKENKLKILHINYLSFLKPINESGCSQMMSSFLGGVWIPPPPLVMQNHFLAYQPYLPHHEKSLLPNPPSPPRHDKSLFTLPPSS